MWPKVLAQLIPQIIDLLPHMRRVVPLADKYLSSKAANDAALATMAEGVRSDLGKVTTSNADLSGQIANLSNQLNSLSTQIATAVETITTVGETADQARSAAIALGKSVVTIDRELRSLRSLVVGVLVSAVLLILMVGWLLLTRTR